MNNNKESGVVKFIFREMITGTAAERKSLFFCKRSGCRNAAAGHPKAD